MLPLTGIRVLDLSRLLPGPFCSWLLADFGAEVIRVEEPRNKKGTERRTRQAKGTVPRPARNLAQMRPFDTVSRNKKSIGLNLKHPEGVRIVHQLASTCDVLLEEFRPGVADRLGIGYEAIRRTNPRIIYCSISIYGQTGPYASYPGHDPCALAVAGVLGLNAVDGQEPAFLGATAGDIMSGLHATIGVLIALEGRRQTGEGQHVDIGMTDSALSLLAAHAQLHFGIGRSFRINLKNPSAAVWRTKEGKYLATTNVEPHHWANFCRVIGREDLIPHQHNVERRKELNETVQQIFLTKTREEWLALLHQPEMETQVAPVHENLDEVFADPQVRHREMVMELDHPQVGKVKHLGFPIKLSETPAQVRSLAPLPGQHTEEVLTALGYDAAALSALEESGAIER